MERLINRAYNRFEIHNSKKIIRKLSATSKLRDEINYYKILSDVHPDKALAFAKLLDYNIDSDEFWMDIELYEYPNLGVFLFEDAVTVTWKDIFYNLQQVLVDWTNTVPSVPWTTDEIRNAAYDMYIAKTEREYETLRTTEKDTLSAVFVNDELTINHVKYKNFQVIWPDVKLYIESSLLDFVPTLIHGDFCFNNILYDFNKKTFKFIDPRGSFGKEGIYGDIRYDVAKLYHSVDGTYESFITDNFNLTTSNSGEFELHILNTSNVIKEFESIFFSAYDKKQIKILEGCIFVAMCTRHYDNHERQKAMYLTGIRLLNEGMTL